MDTCQGFHLFPPSDAWRVATRRCPWPSRPASSASSVSAARVGVGECGQGGVCRQGGVGGVWTVWGG